MELLFLQSTAQRWFVFSPKNMTSPLSSTLNLTLGKAHHGMKRKAEFLPDRSLALLSKGTRVPGETATSEGKGALCVSMYLKSFNREVLWPDK